MKKIRIKICMGTHCYVLGGSDLMNLNEKIPSELLAVVEVEGVNCLEICDHRERGNPPYALVNDQLIDEANVNKVIQRVKKLITE